MPRVPKWLVTSLGVDYFGHVTYVGFFSSTTEKADELMAQAGRLSQMRVLDLNWTPVSNAGLRQVRGLTELRYLNLYDTGIDGGGLAHLRRG